MQEKMQNPKLVREINSMVYGVDLSITELARRINTDRKSVYRWVDGVCLPRAEKLEALRELYRRESKSDDDLDSHQNMSLSWLFWPTFLICVAQVPHIF